MAWKKPPKQPKNHQYQKPGLDELDLEAEREGAAIRGSHKSAGPKNKKTRGNSHNEN